MTTSGHQIIFLYSGQGNQYRNMGLSLFKTNPVFRESIERSSAIVEKLLQRSLIEELYASDTMVFDDLLITNPAIVAVEVALYELLKGMAINQDYVTGTSLGEFAAGVAAGAWESEMAIETAVELAKSVTNFPSNGGMLAILSGDPALVAKLCNKHKLFVAAENFAGNFTVSGYRKNLEDFDTELKLSGGQSLQLPVAYPFHTPLLNNLKSSFDYHLACSGNWPAAVNGFISGSEAQIITTIDDSYFWNAITKPINFPALIKYTETNGPVLYVDLGPSGTSATFIKYNLPKNSQSIVLPIMTQYKQELSQLEKLQRLVY